MNFSVLQDIEENLNGISFININNSKSAVSSSYNIWHKFILRFPPTFPMVKLNFFEVTQSKFYKLIWLLKVYMPSNKTEAVLFLTKNEKADIAIFSFFVDHINKVPFKR